MSEESLIASTNEQMLLYSKPAVPIMILTLVIMLVYSPYSSNVFVQSKPIAGGHIECDIEDIFLELVKCCWFEDFGNYSSYVCQTCTEDGKNCGPIVKTDTRDREETPPSTPTRPIPPTIGENVLQQEDEVLEQSADEGAISPQEPSTTEINQSATVE